MCNPFTVWDVLDPLSLKFLIGGSVMRAEPFFRFDKKLNNIDSIFSLIGMHYYLYSLAEYSAITIWLIYLKTKALLLKIYSKMFPIKKTYKTERSTNFKRDTVNKSFDSKWISRNWYSLVIY